MPDGELELVDGDSLSRASRGEEIDSLRPCDFSRYSVDLTALDSGELFMLAQKTSRTIAVLTCSSLLPFWL